MSTNNTKMLWTLVKAFIEGKLTEKELYRQAKNLGFTEEAVKDMLPAPPFEK